MKNFEITRYIKKFLPFIIIFCILATLFVNMFFQNRQTYYAEAVIRFEDPLAVEGKTPSGERLDISEVKSSAVMTKVIENLKLDVNEYSIDDLISRTNAYEVLDPDEAALKESMIDEAMEYEKEPNVFIISFSARAGEGRGFARSILDEILDVYFAEYSEKYINSEITTTSLTEIYNADYDYIEMMEIVSSQVADTLEVLQDRGANNQDFRAASTGKSFMDLYTELHYIDSVYTSRLNATILEYQITKNKEVLISSFEERIRQNTLNIGMSEDSLKDYLKLIEQYVRKMTASGNTDITYEYILDELYDDYGTDENGNVIARPDQTVTYDELIYGWRNFSLDKQKAIIDTAYANYIIDTFSKCYEGGKCSADITQSCMMVSNRDYEAVKTKLEGEIKIMVDSLVKIYDEIEKTNIEYNEYIGAANISTLSSSTVKEGLNVTLYTLIAALFFLVICCGSAILLGRFEDIMRYALYTDHMTGFDNRASFDNYMKKNNGKMLENGTYCMILNLKNHISINKEFGRDMGDSVMKLIADVIRNVFGKMKFKPVYNGNGQFIVIVEKSDLVSVEYIMSRLSLLIDEREVFAEGDIIYDIGLSESGKEKVRSIRTLLTMANKNKIEVVSKGRNTQE